MEREHQRANFSWHNVMSRLPVLLASWERESLVLAAQLPENAKGGGKKEGGGAKPPAQNSPLTSGLFCSLNKFLRKSQNFPHITPSETFFLGGPPKMGPSSRGFALRYVLPPPPFALPSSLMSKGEVFLLTVGVFLLTVKILCLQSFKALLRRSFPL